MVCTPPQTIFLRSLFCTLPVIMALCWSFTLEAKRLISSLRKQSYSTYYSSYLLITSLWHLTLYYFENPVSPLTSVTLTSCQGCFPPLWLSGWLSSPVSWCLNSLRLSAPVAGCVVPASAPFPCLYTVVGRVWVLLGSWAVKPSAASDKCYFKSYVETGGDASNLTFSNDV